jgi:hypothetical protein
LAPHGTQNSHAPVALENALVLQSKSKERICAFAIKFKFAAEFGPVVLHGPVVNRKASTDLVAGFADCRDGLPG